MAAATPMEGTSNDPYGGFAHWNLRPSATPTDISTLPPTFGNSKKSEGDAKLSAPLDIDSSTTGKRSNALAQYSRVVADSGDMRNRMYDDLSLHSIVFASRQLVDAPGKGYNRLSKILGIRGINIELAKHTFTAKNLSDADIDLSGRLFDVDNPLFDVMGRRILHAVRAPTWGYQVESIDELTRRERLDQHKDLKERETTLQDRILELRNEGAKDEDDDVKNAERALFLNREQLRDNSERDPVAVGLRGALRVLDEWSFDGVVQMSELKDAREGALGTSHMLFNIGIRGPSLLRNGSSNGARYGYDVGAAFPWSHPTREEEAAVFDAEIKPRHDLLICLHLVPVMPVPKEGARLRFVYRYTSTRRMWKAAEIARKASFAADVANTNDVNARWAARGVAEKKIEATSAVGPDLVSMRSVVGAWRVGSVIDAKASVAPNEYGGPNERSVQVQASVDGSWVGLHELRERYGTTHDSGVPSGYDTFTNRDVEDMPEGYDAVDQLRMVLGSDWVWMQGLVEAMDGREATLNAANQIIANVEKGRSDAQKSVNDKLREYTVIDKAKPADEEKRSIRESAIERIIEADQALAKDIAAVNNFTTELSKQYGYGELEELHSQDPAKALAIVEVLIGNFFGSEGEVVKTAAAMKKLTADFATFKAALRDFGIQIDSVAQTPPLPTGLRGQGNAPMTNEDLMRMPEPQPAAEPQPAVNPDLATKYKEALSNAEFALDQARDNILIRVDDPPEEADSNTTDAKAAYDAAKTDTQNYFRELSSLIESSRDLVYAAMQEDDEAEQVAFERQKAITELDKKTLELRGFTTALVDERTSYVRTLNAAATADATAVDARPISAASSSTEAVRPAQRARAAPIGSGPASSTGSLFSGSDRSDDDGMMHVHAPVGSPTKAMSPGGESSARAASRGRRRVASPTDDDDDSVVVMPPPPPPGHRTGSAKNPRARAPKSASKGAGPPAP